MRFYLGTHQVCWLERTDVPLFISHRRLQAYKRLPRARGQWALDSGGFTELSMHGEWTVSPHEYVVAVRRYMGEVGGLQWAAIQDWMCEPFITAKTLPTTPNDMAVSWHQSLTVESYLTLSHLAPEVPWAPVIQGWRPRDYFGHVEMYDKAGIDLRALPIVGVGSVCRRQDTSTAAHLFRSLGRMGIKTHGFGVKTQGLEVYGQDIASADSMAWSFAARRRQIRLKGCTHKTCANCMRWALRWRADMLGKVGTRTSAQVDLFYR